MVHGPDVLCHAANEERSILAVDCAAHDQLWSRSITVASICRIVAQRTKVMRTRAF